MLTASTPLFTARWRRLLPSISTSYKKSSTVPCCRAVMEKKPVHLVTGSKFRIYIKEIISFIIISWKQWISCKQSTMIQEEFSWFPGASFHRMSQRCHSVIVEAFCVSWIINLTTKKNHLNKYRYGGLHNLNINVLFELSTERLVLN